MAVTLPNSGTIWMYKQKIFLKILSANNKQTRLFMYMIKGLTWNDFS